MALDESKYRHVIITYQCLPCGIMWERVDKAIQNFTCYKCKTIIKEPTKIGMKEY